MLVIIVKYTQIHPFVNGSSKTRMQTLVPDPDYIHMPRLIPDVNYN